MLGSRGIPPRIGGVETHVYNVSKRLAEKGHNVEVYCRTYYTPQEAVVPGVKLRRLPTLNHKYTDMPVHSMISGIVARFGKYDILHIHGFDPALFILPFIRGKRKIVVTIHSQNYLQVQRWPKWAREVSKRAESYALQLADEIIVINESMASKYTKQYSVTPHVIPNGIEVPTNMSRSSGISVSLPSNYILFVGRLIQSKHVDLLLDALIELGLANKAVVVGGGASGEHYVTRLEKYKSRGVIFTGPLYGDTLDEIYRGAQVVVNPSSIEAQGLVNLEALARGVPLVCSDIEANHPISNFCLMFAVENRLALKDAIIDVMTNLDKYRERANKGKDFISQNYSWDRVVSDLISVYKSKGF